MESKLRVARDIDEVLLLLEEIIHRSENNKDRIGYFAALYHKVTCKVKEGIENGQFGNGEGIEQLDVMFANRYLYALQQWKSGQPVSRSWEVAFKASQKRSNLILQHLLLGINAHINLDLGIATVETCKGGKLEDLQKDFDSINTILAALTYGVINTLDLVSPLLSFLGFRGTKSNSMLVQFSIGNARDGSWCFAEDLFKKSGNEYIEFIKSRDFEIAELGENLIKQTGFLRFGVWLIHVFEWKNVRRVIDILHTYKKPYKKELKPQ